MPESTRIPPEQIAFCQAVAKLAKEHGCTKINLTYDVSVGYQPEDHAPWDSDILMSWDGGRHNQSDRLHINTTIREYINIYEKR